ncbi:single-stranded DNA-binding protein [Ruania zhangjianzhongii]|uniref:single-stranded DNA-binding protein n=1 Tax=Ruania zhangjianzhongii TaxID=2603206 RepID=UPI0011C96127|nr:single-stranded DNA-binding protein [Ruania zhangjianzhongii]
MVNEIEVTLRGHVGHEPNLLASPGKQTFLRLNVASTPRVRSREGEWGDGATQWFAVKLFGEFAEHVAHSVRKGDAVLVRGRLEHEEYQTRDGEQRWTAVIVADAFGPDLRTATAHVTRAVRRADAETETGSAATEEASEPAGTAADSASEEEADSATEAGEATESSEEQDAGVDLSGFQVLPDDDTETEESMAERMSA